VRLAPLCRSDSFLSASTLEVLVLSSLLAWLTEALGLSGTTYEGCETSLLLWECV
jgi:hypothetical protein